MTTTADQTPLSPGWRRCVHCGAAYVPTGWGQRWCHEPACQRERNRRKLAASRERQQPQRRG